MNRYRIEIVSLNTLLGKPGSLVATIARLLTFSGIVIFVAAGCTGKDAKETSASTTTSGQTVSAGGGATMKPTSEQEAAKQRAMTQGPAMQAAMHAGLKKAQGNK